MCNMKKKNIDLVTDNKGACSTIVGLVDIPGRKFYPWSIWSLAHLSKGRLVLFSNDLKDSEFVLHKTRYDWYTLGLPAPALFPKMMDIMKYIANMEEVYKLDCIKMLSNYTVAPKF